MAVAANETTVLHVGGLHYNHRAKLLGAGLADERSLDWVGRLLGDEAIEQRSTTSGESGRRSTTDSKLYRPLAPANLVREARSGTALLVYGNLPPAWIELRPWFADRRLRRLVQSATSQGDS